MRKYTKLIGKIIFSDLLVFWVAIILSFFSHGHSQLLLLIIAAYALMNWRCDKLDDRIKKLEGKNG